ncbi:MAG TPA: ester cyclase [Thermoanaerobaculia bacterium]|nr:ester cyclase [Thermoanaerobaculia bacterium]
MALIGLCLISSAAFAQQAAPDPLQANKALVQRYIEEVLSANKLEKLDEMLGADFKDSTPGVKVKETGLDIIRAAQSRIRFVFPTVEYKVEDLIAEGDKVLARYTVRATTHAEEGAPAQNVEIAGMTLFRISEGKIREVWILNDQVELYRQLGFSIQPPEKN